MTSIVPVAITRLEVSLLDDVNPVKQEAGFRLMVEFSDGYVKEISGSLAPHLTEPQIAQLLSFMSGLRIQAETQILP